MAKTHFSHSSTWDWDTQVNAWMKCQSKLSRQHKENLSLISPGKGRLSTWLNRKKLLERGLGCPWIQQIFLDYSEAQRLPWRGHSKQYGNCNNCNILQQLQYGICNKLVRGQRRCGTTLIMIKGGKNQEGTKTVLSWSHWECTRWKCREH